MADTYEGWSNRETWAANLWLANDQGLYEMVNEWAAEALGGADEGGKGQATDGLASQLKEFFDDLAHGEGDDDYVPTPAVHRMLEDIGSLYRVDWDEIAQSWVQECIEEMAR